MKVNTKNKKKLRLQSDKKVIQFIKSGGQEGAKLDFNKIIKKASVPVDKS